MMDPISTVCTFQGGNFLYFLTVGEFPLIVSSRLGTQPLTSCQTNRKLLENQQIFQQIASNCIRYKLNIRKTLKVERQKGDISDSFEIGNSDDAGDPDFSGEFGEFSNSIEADEFGDSGETVNSFANVDSCGTGDSGE